EEADHAGVQSLVRDLNGVYKKERALWALDNEPAGFWWLEANDADDNVVAFCRASRNAEDVLVCICNLSPVPREGYRVGLPRAGRWVEAPTTDSEHYGGANIGNYGGVEAEDCAWHDQPQSALVTLPPLGVLWLVPEGR